MGAPEYDSAMTIESLKKYHSARPFSPFILHLADQRQFRVNHPEFLAVTGGGRIVIVGDEKGDGADVIDLLLVTSIELPGERNRKNGRGRRAA